MLRELLIRTCMIKNEFCWHAIPSLHIVPERCRVHSSWAIYLRFSSFQTSFQTSFLYCQVHHSPILFLLPTRNRAMAAVGLEEWTDRGSSGDEANHSHLSIGTPCASHAKLPARQHFQTHSISARLHIAPRTIQQNPQAPTRTIRIPSLHICDSGNIIPPEALSQLGT